MSGVLGGTLRVVAGWGLGAWGLDVKAEVCGHRSGFEAEVPVFSVQG